MSDVRSCKGGTVRTESKDLAPYLHSSLLTPDLIRGEAATFIPNSSFLIPHSRYLPLAIFSQIRYSNYIARYMIHEINEARIYYEQYRTTPDG